MSGPANFVTHHIWREACPESVKEQLGGMTVTEVCGLGALIAASTFAAGWAMNAILKRLNEKYNTRDQSPCR